VPVRRPLKALSSALAPVALVSVLTMATMVTVVIVIGVGIEIFDAVGMRSSSFGQIRIVAAIGMVDVVGTTKIAIELKTTVHLAGRFYAICGRLLSFLTLKIGLVTERSFGNT
jgi:hypothetical protein